MMRSVNIRIIRSICDSITKYIFSHVDIGLVVLPALFFFSTKKMNRQYAMGNKQSLIHKMFVFFCLLLIVNCLLTIANCPTVFLESCALDFPLCLSISILSSLQSAITVNEVVNVPGCLFVKTGGDVCRNDCNRNTHTRRSERFADG